MLRYLPLAIAFALPNTTLAETIPAADAVGVPAVKTWATNRLATAENAFNASGFTRAASPQSWVDQVVYQIQVDRFANGNTGNDGPAVATANIPNARHGGDLQGIINRLDYLKNLGVTTLWLTPVLKGNGDYHGYCVTDYTQVDPIFGDNLKLRELTNTAHQKGIRIVLDIVVNHLCDKNTTYSASTPFNDTDYANCTTDFENRQWNNGGTPRGQRNLNFGATLFPAFRSPFFFSRCGHKAGDFASHGAGALWGDFSPEMFDLDTLNWDMQDIFTDMHKWWIAYADIDGFRLDAAKHVSADFVAKLSTDVRDYAKRLGKDNFFVIGEVAANSFEQSLRTGFMRSDINNPANSNNVPTALKGRLPTLKDKYLAHGKFSRPGQNAVYDFAHSGKTVETFRGINAQTPLTIKQWFYAGAETDHTSFAPEFNDLRVNGDPLMNWNILEIHDWPRFAMWNNDATKLRGALGYLLTAMGTPVLYYGVEQGMNAICPSSRPNDVAGVCNDTGFMNHARYRQDMFVEGPWRLGSVESSINAKAGIGASGETTPANWLNDPYLRRDHTTYKWTRKLNHIRQSCAPLRRGWTWFRQAWNTSDGLLAFSRTVDGEEVLIVQNFGSTWRKINPLNIDGGINSSRDGTTYRNLLNGFQRGRVGNLNGSKGLTFFTQNGNVEEELWVGPYGTMIFAHESKMADWSGDLETHVCGTPNRAPIAKAGADKLVLTGGSFAVSHAGSSDPDGDPITGLWTPSWGAAAISGLSATFTTPPVGAYNITFKVTDSRGASSTDKLTVNVVPSSNWKRTVIYIGGQTVSGQDMYIRGGIDHGFASTQGLACTAANKLCAMPIQHRLFVQDPKRSMDKWLDWYGNEAGQGAGIDGSPLVWTTNNINDSNKIDVQEYGYDPENTWGPHYWKLDVVMDCSKAILRPGSPERWFELKSFISGGPGWESDVQDVNSKWPSGNHFAACGKKNKFDRNSGASIITDFP
jgi:glycosidase